LFIICLIDNIPKIRTIISTYKFKNFWMLYYINLKLIQYYNKTICYFYPLLRFFFCCLSYSLPPSLIILLSNLSL
jgi:hypothetical protein